MTISEWLSRAQARLAETGCPDPAIDARWMAEDALGMSRAELKFEGDSAVPAAKLRALDRMLERRAAGEPVQYILGRADFMGLPFYVDHSVLIPRQDTETLVESALIDVRRLSSPAVLDLCCGSGCIGLSLKSLAPHAEVTLTDVSDEALEIARRHARALEADVQLRRGDLFDAVKGRRFDVIASNPPYIPRRELAGLQREVQYEPALALDGGEDGLDFYRRIAAGAPAHLNHGGSVFLEVGAGEAGAALALLKTHIDCADSGAIEDLNHIDRVIWARMK